MSNLASLEELKTKYDSVKESYYSFLQHYNFLNKKLEDYEVKLAKSSTILISMSKVKEFLKAKSNEERRVLQQKISGIVSYGIQVVFGSDIEFFIKEKVSEKTGDVNLDFMLKRKKDGAWYEVSILGSSGGGLVNLICFLLNVVFLLVHPSNRRKIMLIDEAWSNVDSQGRSDKVKELIESLAEKTGIQFIITTHKQGLTDAGDIVYQAYMNDKGETVFEKIK